MKRIIWIALNVNNGIMATWFTGCVVPLKSWKISAKNIGAIKFQKHTIVLYDWLYHIKDKN